MAILATLPGPNLFSSLPTIPPSQNDPSPSPTPKPPIPIPKYPPPFKKSKTPPNPQSPPAFKTVHRRSNYYKPVRDGVISTDGDRSVVVGESGLSYQLPGAPFEFQFSYSETPKVKPLAIREPAFLPFAPPTMPRPWTGKAPMKKSKRKIKLFGQSAGSDDEDDDDDDGDNGGMKLEMLKAYQLGNFVMRPREEVLGKPLTRMEIKELIRRHLSSNRQVNLGRDGLTHNMLELIHTHWRRDPVCKVRCLGVPTVDMKNVCRCLEEKTGGKIIYRVGGVIYLFRGRNYDHRARPKYPVMLWKPATPVYPKLIQDAPEGLTKDEADELRKKGKNLLPICKLAKNGVYMTLVRDVKHAFEQCPLVKVDCTGMHASDYKKIGAKLKELVPCVLLSFDDEQILMWRGHNWKSMYGNASASSTGTGNVANKFSTSEHNTDKPDESKTRTVTSSPKMMSLWKKALDSNKAMVLDDIGLGPDALLKVIEEFTSISQAAEHSYPALITSEEKEEDGEEDQSQSTTNCEEDEYDEDETYDSDYNDQYDIFDSAAQSGSLPVDAIANRLHDSKKWGSNRDFR